MKKFIIASTLSDAHTWNLVFLQLLIEECGHEVVNIGNCAPVDVVLERCRLERPDYLLISSVNGHGFQDGLSVASAIKQDKSLEDMGLIIGGKLNTRDSDEYGMERSLLAAGYDYVFQGDHAAERFRILLNVLDAPRISIPTNFLAARHFTGAQL